MGPSRRIPPLPFHLFAIAILLPVLAEPADDDGHRFFEKRTFTIGNFTVGDQLAVEKAKKDFTTPIVIESESLRVFGAEGHHTTLLGLKFLSRNVKKGDKVIDYGTGTGIQGIAAMKLGAKSVLAVDIDHEAVEVAEKNAHLNGFGSEFESRLAQNIDGTEGPFDLCIANILPGVLIDLAPHLALYLKPGAKIGLTGLKKRDIKHIKAAFDPMFDFAEEHTELTHEDSHLPSWSEEWGDQKDWVLLTATRSGKKIESEKMSAHAHGERLELEIFTMSNIVIGIIVLTVMATFPKMGKLKGE